MDTSNNEEVYAARRGQRYRRNRQRDAREHQLDVEQLKPAAIKLDNPMTHLRR
jgi:hypothetical protein